MAIPKIRWIEDRLLVHGHLETFLSGHLGHHCYGPRCIAISSKPLVKAFHPWVEWNISWPWIHSTVKPSTIAMKSSIQYLVSSYRLLDSRSLGENDINYASFLALIITILCTCFENGDKSLLQQTHAFFSKLMMCEFILEFLT